MTIRVLELGYTVKGNRCEPRAHSLFLALKPSTILLLENQHTDEVKRTCPLWRSWDTPRGNEHR